jgi:hypothetical protein
MKKERAAKGLAPESDKDSSDLDDTEESKDNVEDPAITKMKAESAAKKKETTFTQ